MKCFYCGYLKTIVLDSRGTENFSKVMRRRFCPKCRKRATTFEMIFEQYEKVKKGPAAINLTEIYKSIVKQLSLLEKSIKLINPE